jgi:hypothetical protein
MGGHKEALPRKKDWKPGQYQLGLFYRTPDGSTLYIVADKATEVEVETAHRLIKLMTSAAQRAQDTKPDGDTTP